MFSIKVEGQFSSAHNLRGYKGRCEQLHGHNWKVEVTVAKEMLDKAGMVMDFRVLKDRLNEILDKLDHKYLNAIAYFKKVNPTSEGIAKYIFDRLVDKGLEVDAVTVWESQNSSATYRPC